MVRPGLAGKAGIPPLTAQADRRVAIPRTRSHATGRWPRPSFRPCSTTPGGSRRRRERSRRCGEQAAQWQGQHPEADASATAEQASERIRREVGERWGVDVTELVGLAELHELDRQYEAAVQEREQLVGVPDNTVPTDRLARG